MPLRNFDHDGSCWTVWDTRPTADRAEGRRAAVADGFAEGWLTFQCEAEKRRLVPVPGDWFDLGDAQLAHLLERAAIVGPVPAVSRPPPHAPDD